MTREEQLESMLTDLHLTASGVLQQKANPIARAELRRACGRVQAFYRAEKAQADLEAAHPQGSDPRPEPPPPSPLREEGGDDCQPVQVRMPYPDD